MKSRLQPLLRLNEWARLEADQTISERRSALNALQKSFADVERQLAACHYRVRSCLASDDPRGAGYVMASEQAGAWLLTLQRVSDEVRQAESALEEALKRAFELERQRAVLERRDRERHREQAGRNALSECADLDSLWLLRNTQ